MRVLRDNKDSLMAVLEAFVHDPLINWWRSPNEKTAQEEADDSQQLLGAESASASNLNLRIDGDKNDHTNPRALAVITRVSNKLTGIFC
jgi:FKBP12-rapamycin complex-associated protein